MKLLMVTVTAALLLPAWAAAQKPASAAGQKLNLNFPSLAAQAKEKVEVDLDGDTVAQSLELAGGKKGADALSGVKAVHVRNYEFAAAGAYPVSALDPLRRQVAANPAWSRIVNVKEENESTEIFFLKPDAGQPGGFLLISAEAKEVTVVEVLGTLELSRLQELVQSSVSYDLKKVASVDAAKDAAK
jgi:hypothetical protein